MKTFTFVLLGGLAPLPSRTVEDFPAAEDALEFAHDLLALTTYDAIEVKLADEEIGVVRR